MQDYTDCEPIVIFPREPFIEDFIDQKVFTESCFYCGNIGETYSLYNSILGLVK